MQTCTVSEGEDKTFEGLKKCAVNNTSNTGRDNKKTTDGNLHWRAQSEAASPTLQSKSSFSHKQYEFAAEEIPAEGFDCQSVGKPLPELFEHF